MTSIIAKDTATDPATFVAGSTFYTLTKAGGIL